MDNTCAERLSARHAGRIQNPDTAVTDVVEASLGMGSSVNGGRLPSSPLETGPNRQFHATGLERVHWRTASPVRDIFKAAFVAADAPPAGNPRRYRQGPCRRRK
jgi:hypothetical protein